MQVETFKTGGVITERRDEWCDKLRQNTSPLAQNMLAFLGGGRSMEVAGPSNALPVAPQQQASPEKKPKSSPLPVPVLNLEAVNRLCVSKPCPPELAGQECCVCQEKLLLRTPISTLPCNHVFHQHCIHTWLKVRASLCCAQLIMALNPVEMLLSRVRSAIPHSNVGPCLLLTHFLAGIHDVPSMP